MEAKPLAGDGPRKDAPVNVKAVSAAQFHTGVQFGTHLTSTGINAAHHTERLKLPVAMSMMPAGVLVTIGTEGWVVPYSNVLWVKLV